MSEPSSSPKPRRTWRLSFRVTVVSMFLFMTLATAAVGMALQYHFSTHLATKSTLALYRQAADRTREYLSSLDRTVTQTLRLVAPRLRVADADVDPAQVRSLFASILREHRLFYAAYVGLANGDFYELVNLDNGATVRRQLMALPQDRWVVISVGLEDGKRLRKYAYYDKNFRLRTSRSAPTNYDPSARPWYQSATVGKVHKTAPYLFQHLQLPGQTYSIRLPGGQAVMAIDITLAALSEQLDKHKLDPDSQIYLYQSNGELIAKSGLQKTSVTLPAVKPLKLTPAQQKVVADNPVLTVSSLQDWAPFDFTISGQPQGYSVETLSLISQLTGLKFRFVNGSTWPQFVEQFRDGKIDVLASVMCGGANAALGQETQPYVYAPYGVLTKRGVPPVSRIEQLYGKRVAIPEGWSILGFIRQHFPQIHVVAVDGVQGMFSAVRNGKVYAGLDNAAEIQYTAREFFYKDVKVDQPLQFDSVTAPTGLCYIVRSDRGAVVSLINHALDQVTPAQKDVLKNRWLLTSAKSRHLSSTVPYPELVAMAANPSRQNSLQQVALNDRQQFVFVTPLGGVGKSTAYFSIITPVANVLAPAYAEVKKGMWFTLGIWLLILPLAYWLASLIVTPVKLLALEEEKIRDKKYGELRPVVSHIDEIDDLAASQSAMAKAIQRHAEEQEALMDAFIKLIAEAIDEKSPYTGAHCARVPELALMLAHKAEDSSDAPFDRFRFEGEGQWREFRIGAWLHDCGKITTPEYIVDKGTKLETIYNRIHEIRTRFEVLWRDVEIEYWEKRCAEPESESTWRTERDHKQTVLQEQFAFVASCNVGGESMQDEHVARLEQLAKITWQRHFDDRLGLSPVELKRLDEVGASTTSLPATEHLLADKAWHIEPRTRDQVYPERFGIKMDVPKLRYNRGELYNLKIGRGTLTAEDRFKINEHIISTIRMLDALPLPEELSRVPRYASTHHETLDGRGYPRRLTAKDLSIPERIMVLADIFEALTAADRPYKKAKSLSVAIDIMYQMVEEQHIDRDVFELFLRSGTYLDYARQYLKEAQIDDVDIHKYLKSA